MNLLRCLIACMCILIAIPAQAHTNCFLFFCWQQHVHHRHHVRHKTHPKIIIQKRVIVRKKTIIVHEKEKKVPSQSTPAPDGQIAPLP